MTEREPKIPRTGLTLVCGCGTPIRYDGERWDVFPTGLPHTCPELPAP